MALPMDTESSPVVLCRDVSDAAAERLHDDLESAGIDAHVVFGASAGYASTPTTVFVLPEDLDRARLIAADHGVQPVQLYSGVSPGVLIGIVVVTSSIFIVGGVVSGSRLWVFGVGLLLVGGVLALIMRHAARRDRSMKTPEE